MTGQARREATMRESDFQARVIDLAHLRGWRVHHTRPARTARGNWITPLAGDRGAPDLLLARNGAVLLAELKTAAGRLGPGQADWLDALGDHGRLWRPGDWGAIVEELR